jgi:hypothetical protein
VGWNILVADGSKSVGGQPDGSQIPANFNARTALLLVFRSRTTRSRAIRQLGLHRSLLSVPDCATKYAVKAITDNEAKELMKEYRRIALPATAIARAIAYAFCQRVTACGLVIFLIHKAKQLLEQNKVTVYYFFIAKAIVFSWNIP